MWAHTKETQDKITPDIALDFLKEGNKRFVNNLKINRNLLHQVNQTSEGQFPFAVILSCIDSRTSAELIFDQGLGDIFSIRIAGNILNDDILGSIEYACEVANSKLVFVLGHTNCGAVTAACNNFKMGHFTNLLNNIGPAIKAEYKTIHDRNGTNMQFVDNVSSINVKLTINKIMENSLILNKLKKENRIKITGGLYNVATGGVDFFND